MIKNNLSDLFFNQGNRQAVEEVKYLRLAQITSVDTVNMMCSLNILDKTSTRTTVPIPMPMAYPGGGIFAVPTVGTHVVVGIRPMQMPLVLGYYPLNTMAPDSYYQMYKQVYGMPEDLQEGEVYIRVRGDSAKCLTCGVTSLLTAWEANINATTLIEQCPNCHAPAFLMDPVTQLPLPASINKQLLGSTLYMTNQAELSYMADNLMDQSAGDKTSLFQLYINGKTGEVTFANAGDVSFESNGTFSVQCQNYMVKADNAVTEMTQNKSFDTNQSLVEGSQDRTINADNSINLNSYSLNETLTGPANLSMSDRYLSIDNSDSYEAASATVFISGDPLGNGRVTQIGTATGSVPDQMILYGNEFRNVYGDSTVEITGDISTTLATGDYELIALKGHISIAAATGTLNLSGNQIVLNSWAGPPTIPASMGYTGQGISRINDTVVSDVASDPKFWPFVQALTAFLNLFISEAPSVLPPGALSGSIAAAAAAVKLAPSSLTSKITTGNITVLA